MNEWKKWPIKEISKKDLPKGLKKISDCPEKLYYRGNWNEEIFEKTLEKQKKGRLKSLPLYILRVNILIATTIIIIETSSSVIS